MSSTHLVQLEAPGPARPAVTLVLDRPSRSAGEEAHLAALADRLLDGRASHVTIIGAGAVHPDRWQIGARLAAHEACSLGAGKQALHFRGAGTSLTLLPEQVGRMLVLAAARKLAAQRRNHGVSVEQLDHTIAEIGGASPDLVIVTGGASHLRGALTWQAAYAELVFLCPSWTEIDVAGLDGALAEFAGRDRRFGIVSAEAG